MKKETKGMKGMVNELEVKLEEFFTKKVWQMPKKVKEIIVKVLPYLAILSLVAVIPMVLSLVGLSMATPMVYMRGWRMGMGYSVSILFTLVAAVLAIVIIPGLFKKEMKAWKIMFWMSLVNAVGTLIRMDLGGLIIGTGLSWYVLFQIKEYYKK